MRPWAGLVALMKFGEMVLFMCSEACDSMTADTVYINGGGGWR